MLKKEDIDRFYEDVQALGLKFPGAAIAEATGHSKSNVSKYLNRKLEPSESFLNVFYEKFPKEGKKVSRETNGHVSDLGKPATTSQLLETINLLVRQNDKLADTNRILAEKIGSIPVGADSETQRSVDTMLQGLRELLIKVATGVRYKSQEEARSAYRKELGDVLKKSSVKDIHSS